MLNIERVFSLFCLFADLESGEAQRWRWVCENAANSLVRRLRKGVDLAFEMERLCIVAAALAYDSYVAMEPDGFSKSDEIKVGDITIKNSDYAAAKSDSGLIGEHFLAGVYDLLEPPESFLFRLSPAIGESI